VNLAPFRDAIYTAAVDLHAAERELKRLAALPPLRRRGINHFRGAIAVERWRVRQGAARLAIEFDRAIAAQQRLPN
jgi:hypothetical protein